jgi:hypothetical protein
MTEEPIGGQLGNLLEGAGLLEQVSRAGYDGQSRGECRARPVGS